MDELKFTYEKAFSGVGPSSETREKILGLGAQRRKRPGRYVRRLSGALAAAIIMAALLGCGVVATIYGDSIQNWFSHYWEAITGQPMSESQTALIDHLTQEIGLSQTVDGITVTVDSATMGEDSFYLLVRAEGAKFSRRYGYSFDMVDIELTSEPTRNLASYGFEYHGLDGDGAVLLMFEVNCGPGTSPLGVELKMHNFRRGPFSSDKLLAHGPWEFSFTLDRSQPIESIELPDTTVYMREWDGLGDVSILLTDIRVSSTGMYFQYDAEQARFHTEFFPELILKNGAAVHAGSGHGTPLGMAGLWQHSWTWAFPVDLAEADYIRIGRTEIPIP